MFYYYLVSWLFGLINANGIPKCTAAGTCQDNSLGPGYSCSACLDTIREGEDCPVETDPQCGANCEITAASSPPAHTMALDASAAAAIFLGNVKTDYFSISADCGAVTCTSAAANLEIIGDDYLIDITTVHDTDITLTCSEDGESTTADALASIHVECKANSTDLTESSFDGEQTVDLLPGVVPTFSFTPDVSSETQCESKAVASDTSVTGYVTSTWSSHFDQTTVDNKFTIVDAEKYVPRVLDFFTVLSVDGHPSRSVGSKLTTKCVPASIPLDFSDLEVYIDETSPLEYRAAYPIYEVTGCTPLSYTATGDSRISTIQVEATELWFTPVDPTLKATYDFMITATLPGSVTTTGGPFQLKVGCRNYIQPTLVESATSAALSSTLIILLDATNTGVDGEWTLELNTFTSSLANCPTSSIITYEASSSSTTQSSFASAEASYSAGSSSFQLKLDTTALGLFNFFARAQDDEMRWVNQAFSSAITFQVTCGSEVISVTQPTTYTICSLNSGTCTIDFSTLLDPYFETTKAQCDITSFAFSHDSSFGTTWVDTSFITLVPGAGLTASANVPTTSADKQTMYIKGTSDGSKSAIIGLDIVVCGNEEISQASVDDGILVANATNTTGTTAVFNSSVIESFFIVDASYKSHEDCLIGGVQVFANHDCTGTLASSALSVSSNEIVLDTENAAPPVTAYVCLTSKGQKSAVKKIIGEVCGHEDPQSDPEVEMLTKKAQVGSGQNGIKTLKFSEYNSTLNSTSDNCLLVDHTLATFHESNETFTEYTGTLATMLPSFEIEYSTAEVGIHYFHIKGEAQKGTVAYLKVRIEIYEFMTDAFMSKINTPPFFDSAPDPVTLTGVEGLPTEAMITLPEVLDSHSNFCGLFVESENLGAYFISNSTSVTEWKGLKSGPSSFLAYSFGTNSLKLSLPSEIDSLVLTLTLVDEDNDSTSYPLKITIETQVAPVKPEQENQGQEALPSDSGADWEGVTTDITAEIKELTKYGLLKIHFSQPMKTENISPEALSEVLELTLEPVSSGSDRNLTDLGFSWVVQRYEGQSLDIEIKWDNMFAISQNVELDTMVLKIVDKRDYFQTMESLTDLPEEYTVLRTKVPRQLEETTLTKSVDTAMTTAKGTLMGATWAAFAVNTVLSGFLNMMLGLVNSLQLIVHLPMFNIIFPPNAFMVFESLIPLVTFDLLEAFEDEVSVVMDLFVSNTDDEEEVPQQFQNVGFEDFRPLPNLGTLGLMLILYFTKVILFGMTLVWHRLTSRGSGLKASLKKQLFFSEILLIFIEGYLDFSIATGLFLSWEGISGGRNWAAFTWIAVVAFLLVPGALVWIGTKPSDKFVDPEFCEKWGPLFEDIKTKDVGQRLFFLAFILRRAAMSAAALSLAGTPSMQLIALNLSNLSLLIYQGYFKSIISLQRNFIERTNETLIYISSFHLMAFTSAMPDSLATFYLGWSLAAVVGLHIIFNFGAILQMVLRFISLRIQFLWYRVFPRKIIRKPRLRTNNISFSDPSADFESQQAQEESSDDIASKALSVKVRSAKRWQVPVLNTVSPVLKRTQNSSFLVLEEEKEPKLPLPLTSSGPAVRVKEKPRYFYRNGTSEVAGDEPITPLDDFSFIDKKVFRPKRRTFTRLSILNRNHYESSEHKT